MSVDDDFVNQEVMRSILEPSGFQSPVCIMRTQAEQVAASRLQGAEEILQQNCSI